MKKEHSLLLVEDNEGDVRIIEELLKEQSYINFKIAHAGTIKEATVLLSDLSFDTILLDLGLPDSQGFETFDKLNRAFPDLNAIIILTGLNDTEVGLKAVNQGAQDYIVKGQIDSNRLLKSIIYAYERNRLSNELKAELEAKRIAQEALIKALNKAEESDKLKTAFLHNISHEIRTPMNAIVGFSALLCEPGLSAEKTKSFTETIIQSSDHLLTIINDIVEISFIEANLIKTSKTEVNLNTTLKSVSDVFILKTRELGFPLKIKTQTPEYPVITRTDSSKIYQVLSNLVNNAIKFTESGEIELGYSKKGKSIEFHVSDTGIGISDENKDRIFERFFQVEYSETRQYEGTGLGLAICKAYVELLGGKIWVNSEVGKGSVFYFTLPFEDEEVDNSATKQTLTEEIEIAKGKKILVAEDIESNYNLIRLYLNSINAESIMVKNGKEAVDYFKSHPDIDLILMDIKMPVMDGYTAVKLIREIDKNIPIIAQTAYAEDIIKAEESGCNGFISKPFQKQKLLSVLKEFLLF